MSALSFTKLFGSITDSSVWQESSDVRIVWVTMLAMADPLGRVSAAVPGLARRANVSREAAEQALAVFLAPDPDSRSKDHDGRRIEEIDGGWRLLNYVTYREMKDLDARKERQRIYQQRYRNKKEVEPALDDVRQSEISLDDVRQSETKLAQGEGEGEGEGEKTKAKTALVERSFSYYCSKLKKNPKTYTLTPERKKKALLRMEERLSVHGGDMQAVTDEFKAVIDNLSGSEFHMTNGHVDWTAQIFRSADEFEKRINWQKPLDHAAVTQPKRVYIGQEA